MASFKTTTRIAPKNPLGLVEKLFRSISKQQDASAPKASTAIKDGPRTAVYLRYPAKERPRSLKRQRKMAQKYVAGELKRLGLQFL